MDEWAARWGAPAALALFAAIGAVQSHRSPPVVAVCVAVIVGAGVLLGTAGRRLVLPAVVAAAAVVVLCTPSSSNVGWFALAVLAGWCTENAGLRVGAAAAGVALAVFAVEWSAVNRDPGWAAWIAGTLATVAFCHADRRQRELIGQLHVAQAGLADRARVEERNRIARDLHDVIAHSLTVSLLHVASARLAVEEDPAEAVAALVEAERLGRESLAEVRQAVGLLRADGASPSAPMPGVQQLPTLVEGFRRAGADVSYEVVGDPSALTATAGLTVYRILQEALTNAARHAPGCPTAVRVEAAADRTVLTVDSAGPPGVPSPDGAGLPGMRERAEALGGTVSAGPAGAGWRVHAVLP